MSIGGGERQSQQRFASERRIGDRLWEAERWIAEETGLRRVDRAEIASLRTEAEGRDKLMGWLVGLSAFAGTIITIITLALTGHLSR